MLQTNYTTESRGTAFLTAQLLFLCHLSFLLMVLPEKVRLQNIIHLQSDMEEAEV